MNLVTDALFSAETSTGTTALSLPGVLSGLANGSMLGFTGPRRHQQDAFHVFLCYLAGAILVRSGLDELEQDENFWRSGLEDLANGKTDAWSLVEEDPTKPAFMQPPVTNLERFEKYRPKAMYPDEIDVLNTAKNHDVKSARISTPTAEDWIFALVTVQTTAGFFGQGNYGICRMNSGFGSRSFVSLRYSQSRSGVFLDETRRLLDLFSNRLAGPWGFREDGLVLTWTRPWDGDSSIALSELHPFYVEVCRALRLRAKNGKIVAWGCPTKSGRIAAKDLRGKVGDPWSPVSLKKEAVLTVSATGFTPALLRSLIFEDEYALQEMQRPPRGSEHRSCTLYASVLVRGQGKTDGFKDVSVLLPGKVASRLFGGGTDRDRLNELSKEGIELASSVQKRALVPALYSLLEGGPEKIDFGKKQVASWAESATQYYSNLYSESYFPWLWQSIDTSEIDALNEWKETIIHHGLNALRSAQTRMPGRTGRRYRSTVRSENIYFGSARKQLGIEPGVRG